MNKAQRNLRYLKFCIGINTFVCTLAFFLMSKVHTQGQIIGEFLISVATGVIALLYVNAYNKAKRDLQ